MIKRPKGTFDILPDDAAKWHFVEDTARRIADIYGYGEIRTPIFESTKLFTQGVGASTDIVNKEMYTFEDRAGRSISLRPEVTVNVVRAYLENSLGKKEKFVKLYYLGPIFRYEKPQACRFRQHHQFGIEAIGSAEPALDAEVVEILMRLYGELGLAGLSAVVNSVGCKKCRPAYNGKLRSYLKGKMDVLCADCHRRAEKNPLRVFDCKQHLCSATIAQAPKIIGNLCGECRKHFDTFCEILGEMGIEYKVKPELVRGLDYYTRTAFEIISEDLGAQNAVGGGGRYDDLVELLGGAPTPAIGFGTGLERILMLMKNRKAEIPEEGKLTAYVAAWKDEGRKAARELLGSLRRAGIAADTDYNMSSLKSQLRRANKLAVQFVILVGQDEVKRGKARLKSMATGKEVEVEMGGVVQVIKDGRL